MKKIIALLMAVLMTAGMLAACSSTPAEDASPTVENTKAQAETAVVSGEKEKVTLKVWADQGELELTEKLCSEFAAEHPEKEYTFEYGAVGAVDGKARYLEDPAAAADVFLFADDQLVDLVKADALYEVTRNTDAIIAANTPGSINAATYDGTLYGYPMTSDNGYFLYYDKSVFTEDDLKTLDGILAAANAAGKKVHMDVSNGWYLASFFLGNGCTLTIEDGKQVIDFNNANGLAAAEAIRAFCNDPAFVTGDDSVLATPSPAVCPAHGSPPRFRKSWATTTAAASCLPSPVTASRFRWAPSLAARSTASTPRPPIPWTPWSWRSI